MKILKSLLLMMIVVITVKGQVQYGKVSGVVIDTLSQQPLGFANVSIQDTNGKTLQGVTTNDAGTYITNKLSYGKYILLISYVGYANKSTFFEVSTQETTIAPIFLKLEGINLNEVTVKVAKPFIQQELGKITLNIAESIMANGGSATDILKKSPFVKIDNNGGITLKGKGVVIFIDGKATNLSGDNLESLLASISSQGIDKIELISNPSAKYEAAGAAVINIRTLKMRNLGTNGTLNIGIGAGRYPRYNTGIAFNHKTSRFNIYGNYDYQHNQQYFNKDESRILQNETGNSTTFADTETDLRKRYLQGYKVGTDYYISPKTTIGILFNGNHNERSRDVTGLTNIQQQSTKVDVDSKGYAKFINWSINTNLKHTFDSTGKELAIDVDYSNYVNDWQEKINNSYSKSISVPLIFQTNISIPWLQKVNIKSIKADYTNPTKIGSFDIGIQHRNTKTNMNFEFDEFKDQNWQSDNSRSFEYDYNENVSSAYINFRGSSKKWLYQGGIRTEYTNALGTNLTTMQQNKQDYLQFFPSITLNFNPSDTNQFSVSYSRRITRPDYNELNSSLQYSNPYSYYRGNPQLIPSISNAIELGYTYNQSWFLNLSYTSTQNAFTSVPNIENNITILQNQNFDKYDLLSLDVTYYKQLTQRWTTTVGVQGVYVKNILSNLGLQNLNGFTGYAYCQNIIAVGDKSKVELTGYYQPQTPMGTLLIKPLVSVELGFQKPILNDKVNMRLSISDIFNTILQRYEYQSSNYYSNTSSKTETRFIKLGFVYKFGNNKVKSRDRKTGLDTEANRVKSN